MIDYTSIIVEDDVPSSKDPFDNFTAIYVCKLNFKYMIWNVSMCCKEFINIPHVHNIKKNVKWTSIHSNNYIYMRTDLTWLTAMEYLCHK